jgi:hypothetical protein
MAIVAIILLARNPNPNGQKPGGKPVVKATEHVNTDSKFVWTVQGELVGDDQRREVRITVTESERRFEIIGGYNGNVITTETFENNEAAYGTFLAALEQAGFGKERNVSVRDERAMCPLGRRYIYELQEDGDQKLRTWSTSCATSQGPFAGNARIIRELFENQIPGFDKKLINAKINL